MLHVKNMNQRTGPNQENKRQSVSLRVQRDLLNHIKAKKLLPGQYLPPEHALARRYQVSRPSVRKALAALAKAGWLHTKPGKGTMVSDASWRAPDKPVRMVGINYPMDLVFRNDYFGTPLMKSIVDAGRKNALRLEIIPEDALESDENARDGIIWVAPTGGQTQRLAQLAKHTSVVLINRVANEERLNYVSIDDREEMRRAVAYLIRLGHTRIGLIGHSFGVDYYALRKFGYLDALSENGLPVDEAWLLDVGDYRRAYERSVEFLKTTAVSALVIMIGYMILPVLTALYDSGRKAPEDISVLCFDDIEGFIQHPGPGLTSVRQPLHQMGERAVQAVIGGLPGGTGRPMTREILPCELVVRGSCREIDERGKLFPPETRGSAGKRRVDENVVV